MGLCPRSKYWRGLGLLQQGTRGKTVVALYIWSVISCSHLSTTLQHFRREKPSLDQMSPDSKAGAYPVEFSLPSYGYKSADTLPRVSESAEKSIVEHRPLKKRPVDVSSLKLSATTSQTSLPEPMLIRVIKTTPPTILQACRSKILNGRVCWIETSSSVPCNNKTIASESYFCNTC